MQPCSLRSAERPSTLILNPFRFITYICFSSVLFKLVFFRCRTDVPSCRRRLRALGWALHLHLAGGFVPSALCPHDALLHVEARLILESPVRSRRGSTPSGRSLHALCNSGELSMEEMRDLLNERETTPSRCRLR